MPRINGDSESLTSVSRPLASRITALELLLGRIVPVPSAWLSTGSVGDSRASSNNGGTLDPTPCERYNELIVAWRKAMRWTDGLDCALSVMLASVASTKSVGDQLWIKALGPAACGKSTLCEALSVSKDYVLAKSTIRGFHSGWKSDGEEDNSLIAKVSGKTLVTKDGDTLLQSPNLGQILAEARDLYDSTSRTHYRNKTSRDYAGIRMTWILCGTSSLRAIDSSELGERFLDCVIMDRIDDDLEDEILWRVANRADRNVGIESDGVATSFNDPEMTHVMQLTGGYVEYLRENAIDLLSEVRNPEWTRKRCTRLGKFIAYMRARPSRHQTESAEREFAARLVSQLIRLAKCLAVVLNKVEIDLEVMRRVTKVAMDTSRGYTLDMVKHMYLAGEAGSEARALALYTSSTDEKARTMLRFLRQIGVVEPFAIKRNGVLGNPRWRLMPSIQRLYTEVFELDTEEENSA